MLKKYTPEQDGVTHINIYLKAKTPLGRMLSHSASLGFKHPTEGQFVSLEGFWYWISTGRKYEILKQLSGFKAKEYGKQYPKENDKLFKLRIKEAIFCKITQNLELKSLFIESHLPFTHYYVYGGKVIEPSNLEWLVEMYEKMRTKLKEAKKC